jgi:hypothetical protein
MNSPVFARTHRAITRSLQVVALASSLAAGVLAGAAVTGSAVHAGSIPIHLPCREIPNQEQITISAPWTAVGISGSCFLGSTDDVSIYDMTRGKYLTGTWKTVTVDSNGVFFISVQGANCYDRVEAIAYDTGWNSYTNQGNWQSATVECTPK